MIKQGRLWLSPALTNTYDNAEGERLGGVPRRVLGFEGLEDSISVSLLKLSLVP